MKFLTFYMKLFTLKGAFLVLGFKFFTQHETFIFKQFEGTYFIFNTHSYSGHNIQITCVGPNGKVTLFHWRYFIFINLKLLISNLSITFWSSYSVTPTLSTLYPQILLDSGMMISRLTKALQFHQNCTLTLSHPQDIRQDLKRFN